MRKDPEIKSDGKRRFGKKQETEEKRDGKGGLM